MTAPVLPVSLIMVSDYESGEHSWREEKSAIDRLLGDPNGVPAEIILVVPAGREPPQTIAARKGVVTHQAASRHSSALKDAGLSRCSGDLVAVTEADCLPEEGWLAHLTSAMLADPSLDIVSCRTLYEGDGALRRVFSLLDRGFSERRDADGRIRHMSNNGALYRRAVLERHRFPDIPNPFVAAHMRQIAIIAAGLSLAVEPRAVMRHAFGGARFLWDLRRNKGFQYATMDRAAGKGGSGMAVAFRAVRTSWRVDRKAVRALAGQFCRRRDWPLIGIMMVVVRLPEFLGAMAASQPEEFEKSTAYR